MSLSLQIRRMPSVCGTGEREIPKGEVLLAGADKLEKAVLCVMGMNGSGESY